MTQEEITRLRALADAATPGPWETRPHAIDNSRTHPLNRWKISNQRGLLGSFEECDAAFISAARTIIPALLDEVEKAQKFEKEANQILNTQSEIIRNSVDALRKADEEIYRLRGALKPFSDRAALYDCSDANEDVDWFGRRPIITIGDLRRAREAMGDSK